MAASKARQNAIAAQVMNDAIKAMAADGRGNLPEIALDTWGSWFDALIGSPLENQFYPYLCDTIFEQFVTKANYKNRLAKYKKGFVANGAGVKQTFIDKIDALPFSTTNVEKQELKTYVNDVYEANYTLNNQRKYPVSQGRLMWRGYVQTPEKVIDLIDMIKSMMYTSNEMDENGLMWTLVQNYVLNGKAYVVPVDMSNGIDDFVETFLDMSMTLADIPVRDYNEYGVMNNTPYDRQVLFMPTKVMAKYQNTLASKFNDSRIDFMSQVEPKAYFDKPYSELQKMRENEIAELGYTAIPNITSADTAILKNVVGILMDTDFMQIYDVVNEMWDKTRASQMDVNYFLHVWQIFATSPFANFIIFVDSTAATTQPSTINVKVLSKTINAAYTEFVLGVERTASSLVGGGLNFVQTDELAADKVMVTKTGLVRIPTGTDPVTLTGKIRDVNYKAASAIVLTTDGEEGSPAVTNVGDTIVFNKQ